jgi:hypothetical protein
VLLAAFDGAIFSTVFFNGAFVDKKQDGSSVAVFPINTFNANGLNSVFNRL